MNNDILLVPSTVEQPNVEAQSDIVVYIPQAHKNKPGIVKEGEGVFIENGVVSLDKSEITIKSVSINDEEILQPDENKHINIRIDKNTVGLSNVDNTSDLDKPLSNKAIETINNLSTEVKDSVNYVDNRLTQHILDFNNPHKVTKSQVGLSNVDNTSDINKPISISTQQALDKINAVILGRSDAIAFDRYFYMVNALSTYDKKKYNVGQSIYIRTLNVPDVWIYSVDDVYEEYFYENDEVLIDSLQNPGFVKIGYYTIAALETGKISLDDYVTVDTNQTIKGNKNFTGSLMLDGTDVATQKDISDNMISDFYFSTRNNNYVSESVEGIVFRGNVTYGTHESTDHETVPGYITLPIEGDGIAVGPSEDHSTLVLSIEDPFNEEMASEHFVAYTKKQNLTEAQKKLARENIGAGTSDLSEVVDLSNYVTLDTEQRITAFKEISVQGGDDNRFHLYRNNDTMILESGVTDKYSRIDAGQYGLSLRVFPTQDTYNGLLLNDDKMTLSYKKTIDNRDVVSEISITDDSLLLNANGNYLYVGENGLRYNIQRVVLENELSDYVQQTEMEQYAKKSEVADEYVSIGFEQQTIYGVKTFYQQLGITNGLDNGVNYIKHIGDNFLVSASTGEDIINIDEQLKTFNFYNKPLALEEHVNDNYLSFTSSQTLTEEQKQIARNNIGVENGGGVSPDLSNYVTLNTEQVITGNKTINAELEINSTTSDFSKTSHFKINNNTIQLMNQDVSGNGGSVVITPSAGVQITTSGTSEFSYNGQPVVTQNDLSKYVTLDTEQTITSIKTIDVSPYGNTRFHASFSPDFWISAKERDTDYVNISHVVGELHIEPSGSLLVYSPQIKIPTAQGTTENGKRIYCGFGYSDILMIVRSDQQYETVSTFKISPTGIYYNDKEIATKSDIEAAITTTLNTAV